MSSGSSGDFWCKEHSAWNCSMCYLPPGSIMTSGGGMPRKASARSEEVSYFQDHDGSLEFRSVELPLLRTESALSLGEDNYVTREDDVVTVRRDGGKPIVQMGYDTWKRLGGKDL